MIRRLAAWLGLMGFAATPLVGQTGTTDPAPHPCDAESGATRQVCRAGFDAAVAMIPVGGLAVSGGNPSLSGAGGGRKFGEFVLTLRANYTRATLPRTFYVAGDDTVRIAKRLPLAMPSVDMRMTLLNKKLPMGAVSVDLLGDVIAIPRRETGYLRYGPDVRQVAGIVLGFGYGLRIGFEPKAPLPTASLNVARHDLPAFTYGDVSTGSNFAYTLAISAINARLLAGKRFNRFELVGGGGVDLLKGNYSVVYRDLVTGLPKPRIDSTKSTMRFQVLSNGALWLGPSVRLTVEGGFQIGKDEKLPTIFEGNNTKSGRFFGGVGLGFKL